MHLSCLTWRRIYWKFVRGRSWMTSFGKAEEAGSLHRCAPASLSPRFAMWLPLSIHRQHPLINPPAHTWAIAATPALLPLLVRCSTPSELVQWLSVPALSSTHRELGPTLSFQANPSITWLHRLKSKGWLLESRTYWFNQQWTEAAESDCAHHGCLIQPLQCTHASSPSQFHFFLLHWLVS